MKQKLLFKGPVTTASGYGVHARQLLKALLEDGTYDVSVRPISWGNTSFLLDGEFFDKISELSRKHDQEHAAGTKYDVSVQVTIPNEFEKLARVNVGVTAGIEVNIASPEWISKINSMVDVLIVPSKHSAEVLLNSRFLSQDGQQLVINKNPIVVPESFDSRFFNTEPADAVWDFELEADHNFLFVGLGLNKGYGEDRKNVANLVKWFCEAFKDRRDVGLVLKLAIVNNSLMDFNRTQDAIQGIKRSVGCEEFPRILLVHGHLDDRAMGQLYRHPKIKTFITLTHGEGYGLPILEAAASGLPVMATNWSGHLDFLTVPGEKRSFVELEYDLTQVPDSMVWNGVIERGTSWASVREDDVKLKMRKVVASYTKPKTWATRLAKHAADNYSDTVLSKRFVEVLRASVDAVADRSPTTPDELVTLFKKSFRDEDAGPKLLYTMPMSAGDVFLSTAVVAALKRKYPDHKIFFATNKQYTSILEENPDIHRVIPYNDWMNNVGLCEKIFELVYTPNLSIQMVFSNWVRGGKGRRLLDEMAVQCDVDLAGVDYVISPKDPGLNLPDRFWVIHPGSGKGQWEARNYLHWQELVTNLKENFDVPIVQVGTADEPLYAGVTDYRGKTKDYRELAHVVSKAELVVSIDSVVMHMAAAFGVDHIALFGSSYANSTGPIKLGKRSETYLIEPEKRYTCDRACYKYQCTVDRESPCINEIHPKNVFDKIVQLHGGSYDKKEEWRDISPKISGYTHVFNAESGGYPYVQSIRSMLGFCDEVVVVDGGSEDGTVEKIRAIDDPRIKIYERKWDWNEPGMDGMQKAFGRVMCTGDFLWQQDVDEVVHEDDYDKVKKLVKKFPRECSLVHLPVVELWGDEKTVRTDRHSWKWRLSKNDFRITHGIVKHARMVDEETGKTYSKKGMSDGCEYIDLMTGEYFEHRGFYTREIETLRVSSPKEYGELMNRLFDELPVVFHYSWCDLRRKIENFKKFWDKCWTNLYRDAAPEDRFPDVSLEDPRSVESKVEQLRSQGGEHGSSQTFELRRTNPGIMREWLDASERQDNS